MKKIKTEADWLACTDPQAMLEWLHSGGKADRRRLGLLLAACCSRIQPSLAAEWSRGTEYPDEDTYDPYDPIALTDAGFYLFGAVSEAIYAIGGGKAEHATLATAFRDIIGPLPFRPVAIEAPCLTPAVLAIAQAICNEGSFDRLPTLADALERAGCTDTDILSHCRSEGPHVRGCWVVDLLLGKE
jgi:hypothetical protein